jgi:peptidyl-prolyl cis-trans isomerase D
MVKQLGLKTKVLDQLIDEYIIASEAERMKISVTDDELQKAIRGVPAFQQQGQFSADNYRRFLSYQRLTPKDFEEMQRNDLVKLRLYNLVTENVIVSPRRPPLSTSTSTTPIR